MQNEDITQWLRAAKAGDREALDRARSVLYRELHVLAQRQLGGQKDGTLNTTGPVHQTWLRLIGKRRPAARTARTFLLTRHPRCVAS